MRMSRSVALLLLVAACGGTEERVDRPAETVAGGSQPVPASLPAPRVEEGILIVTPGQVRSWQEGGDPFVLVDARDRVQYGREHLPDAINIPYIDIRAGGQLPSRDSRIVLYCSDSECPISQYAYRALERIGFTNLYDMREGLQGWKAQGYPTVIGNPETVDDTP